MTNNKICPCQSSKSYAECCEPLHLQTSFAATAEQLMRSRYCAFTEKNINYIIATTVPAQQKLLDYQDLSDWADSVEWQNLEIVQHQPYYDKNHSIVEFKAYYFDKNQQDKTLKCHHEKSAFVEIDQRWYFLDPTIPNIMTMKQPCFCQSQKKYKLCCAKFLI